MCVRFHRLTLFLLFFFPFFAMFIIAAVVADVLVVTSQLLMRAEVDVRRVAVLP